MTEEKNKKEKKQIKKSDDTDDIEVRAKKIGVAALLDVPTNANKKSIQTLSEDIARKNRMVIFDKNAKDKTLHVAMIDAQDVNALNILRFIAQKDRMNITVYLTSEEIMQKLFAMYGSAEDAVQDVVQS
ncbi:MAG: hypothetical protein U9Q12_00925, partial [Patescibacteria group bacterium]|nr:hypothetical protein [Patescibacteria group bacterium]